MPVRIATVRYIQLHIPKMGLITLRYSIQYNPHEHPKWPCTLVLRRLQQTWSWCELFCGNKKWTCMELWSRRETYPLIIVLLCSMCLRSWGVVYTSLSALLIGKVRLGWFAQGLGENPWKALPLGLATGKKMPVWPTGCRTSWQTPTLGPWFWVLHTQVIDSDLWESVCP